MASYLFFSFFLSFFFFLGWGGGGVKIPLSELVRGMLSLGHWMSE